MVWPSVIKHSSPAWLRLKSAVPCTKWSPVIRPSTNRQVKRIVVSESTWTKCCFVVPSFFFGFFFARCQWKYKKIYGAPTVVKGGAVNIPSVSEKLLTINCLFKPLFPSNPREVLPVQSFHIHNRLYRTLEKLSFYTTSHLMRLECRWAVDKLLFAQRFTQR